MSSDERIAIELLTKQFDVSRETLEKLGHYVSCLRLWQRSINLVSAATLDAVWMRHIVDSAQLIRYIPKNASSCLDLGSGAGFPALVLAILQAGAGQLTTFTLVESSGKKTSFLRHVVQELSLKGVEIRNERIESVIANIANVDVVTARALASLTELMGFVDPLLKTGAIALFPKGRDADQELTIARQHWHFLSDSYPSITDPDAQILKLRV